MPDLPSKGRLRLRSAVPVAKGYEGKAVSREKIFEVPEAEADDEQSLWSEDYHDYPLVICKIAMVNGPLRRFTLMCLVNIVTFQSEVKLREGIVLFFFSSNIWQDPFRNLLERFSIFFWDAI